MQSLERDAVRRLLRSSTRFNLLFAGQVIVGLAYASVTGDVGARLSHFFIPFIWITVSVWALWHTNPVPTRRRVRFLAALVAVGYLLLLFYLSGLLEPGASDLGRLAGASGVGATWSRPLGWSPVLLYAGEFVTVTLVPYQAVGLVALSYLVYEALLDFARSAIGGVVGIAACPACVGPLFAPLLAGGVGGPATALLFGVYGYEVATILFVTAVGVLYHRRWLSTRVAT